MQARFYDHSDFQNWDAFCENSCNGTLLHTRKFLSYHGSRFLDRSIILTEKDRIVGLLPAAIDPEKKLTITSHPGISYGGFVHQGALLGGRMLDAISTTMSFLHKNGIDYLRYKVVPHIYHITPAQDDLYALWRFGASCYRKDLSSCIDLGYRLPRSQRRKRSFKCAMNAGLVARVGVEYATEMWTVLETNLEVKHGIRPVHTLNEILLLAQRFPKEIEFCVAIKADEIVAGLVLFKGKRSVHVQYIAANQIGYEVSALDFLFEHLIERSVSEGMRYFNFGVSTENHGYHLNTGLYKFKSEFGASGLVHEFYELNTYRSLISFDETTKGEG
jgi:hypothetical protein